MALMGRLNEPFNTLTAILKCKIKHISGNHKIHNKNKTHHQKLVIRKNITTIKLPGRP